MTTWTKLSDRQPTEEDFNVGVVFGSQGTERWVQTGSYFRGQPIPRYGYTHWQRISPPEQPRLRRWVLYRHGAYPHHSELLVAHDSPMEGVGIPVIEWPYEADPVPPQENVT